MAWTITIADDKDTSGERTVTGIWTDPVWGEFSFSYRVKFNAAGMDEFIAAAVPARDKWQTKCVNTKEKIDLCMSKILVADPQAGA